MEPDAEALHYKFRALQPLLDERTRRLWAAVEARALGRGGISAVARATGMSRATVRAGLRELADDGTVVPRVGVRRSGGGRKSLAVSSPGLVDALKRKLDPFARGDPQGALSWTCRSAARLAAELRAEGHAVSERSVNRLLHGLGYSLQASGMTSEDRQRLDRDAQFRHISKRVAEFQAKCQPVVSVDTKKKELTGTSCNGARERRPSGDSKPVRVKDFADDELGGDIPYVGYESTAERSWVSLGADHDTTVFAAECLRRWWWSMGSAVYPAARQLLVTAEYGISHRSRPWKMELQELAVDLGLHIAVSHFPPGTSKWDKIEHSMVSHMTQEQRGRPPVSREVVVSLIGTATAEGGLEVCAELDVGSHTTERKVTDEQPGSLNIDREAFHGEWNYTINPRSQSA